MAFDIEVKFPQIEFIPIKCLATGDVFATKEDWLDRGTDSSINVYMVLKTLNGHRGHVCLNTGNVRHFTPETLIVELDVHMVTCLQAKDSRLPF